MLNTNIHAYPIKLEDKVTIFDALIITTHKNLVVKPMNLLFMRQINFLLSLPCHRLG